MGWTLPLRLVPLQLVPLRLGPLGWAVPLRLMPGLGPLQWPKVLSLATVASGADICDGGQNNPDEAQMMLSLAQAVPKSGLVAVLVAVLKSGLAPHPAAR